MSKQSLSEIAICGKDRNWSIFTLGFIFGFTVATCIIGLLVWLKSIGVIN